MQSWINWQTKTRIFDEERLKKEEKRLLYEIMEEIEYYETIEVMKPIKSNDLTFNITSLDEIILEVNPLVDFLEIIKVTIVKMGENLERIKNFDF